jgi:hypothetical protein
MGLSLAVGYRLGMGEWDRVAGQLNYLPGVLLVAAAAIAIAGLLPRWSLLAWAGVAFVFFQVMLSETPQLPDWVDGISPFWHVPGLPVETFNPASGRRARPGGGAGAAGPVGLPAPRRWRGLASRAVSTRSRLVTDGAGIDILQGGVPGRLVGVVTDG